MVATIRYRSRIRSRSSEPSSMCQAFRSVAWTIHDGARGPASVARRRVCSGSYVRIGTLQTYGYGEGMSALSRTDGRPYATKPVSPAAFDATSHSPMRWLYQTCGTVAWTTTDATVPTAAAATTIRLHLRIQEPAAELRGASTPAASTDAGASCSR